MQTVLITGANRGIGLALSQQFAARGDRVIAVCRTGSEALQATGAQVEASIDVADDEAVAALARRLHGTTVDTMLLNAGILGQENLGTIDAAGFDSIRRQFEVNALGPLRVTQALLGQLTAGSSVGIITSRMGSVGDNDSGGYYGYRASKAALNAIGRSLAIDLKPRGIGVFLLHPGYVATEMVGGGGDISPEQSARQLIERLDTLGIEQTGTFWHADGTPLRW